VSIIITIIITILIMLISSLIHIITWEGSQGSQEKNSVILEWLEWSVLALTDPSETCLGLDNRHDVWSKIQVHLKVKSQICQLIHDKSNDIYSISIHHMRDHIQ